jgi:8-amino-7-oxononanoate synthase
MDLFKPCGDYADANFARAAGAYPFFHELDASEGPIARHRGQSLVMMGSNNYLGLTHHPKVIAAAKQAIDDLGTGCTGSRFLNGNLRAHVELEAELAEFFGYEQALVFSSGFLANLGVLATLGSHPGAVLFSERANHASLIDGTRLASGDVRIFEDAADLERQLQEGHGWPHALVILDAVFSMTGRVSDLRTFAALKRRHGFKLYVDDAHGIGVFGTGGRGVASQQGVADDVDLLFGTFSKSLASLGGFVCGDAVVIDYLRHKTRSLIFTAGLPPSASAAALAALRLMRSSEGEELMARLWENARYWKKGLDDLGFCTLGSTSPIVPAMIGSESLAFHISCELFDLGVFAIPVPYPVVPRGQALIRTSVMPTHEREHLDRALEAFATVKARHDLPEFDPDDLPVTEAEDWSWFMPGKVEEFRAAQG